MIIFRVPLWKPDDQPSDYRWAIKESGVRDQILDQLRTLSKLGQKAIIAGHPSVLSETLELLPECCRIDGNSYIAVDRYRDRFRLITDEHCPMDTIYILPMLMASTLEDLSHEA